MSNEIEKHNMRLRALELRIEAIEKRLQNIERLESSDFRKPKAANAWDESKMIPRARVAQIFGVCNRTVKRWEADKLLTPHKISPRLVVYKEEEVNALKSKNQKNNPQMNPDNLHQV